MVLCKYDLLVHALPHVVRAGEKKMDPTHVLHSCSLHGLHSTLQPLFLLSEVCVDSPVDWVDSSGRSCDKYKTDQLCTATGAYGSGWQSNMGFFSDYAKGGKDASEACCACGSGDKQSATRRLQVTRWTSPSGTPPEGRLTVHKEGQGLRVSANLTGLSHQTGVWHIHVGKSCDAIGAMLPGFSAHNPWFAGPDGKVTIDAFFNINPQLTVGRAVVFHQPTGEVIACGLIQTPSTSRGV